MKLTSLFPSLLLGTCLIVSSAARAQDAQLRFSTGVDFSSGDYGGQDKTDILYVPVSASWRKGPVLIRAIVPFISVDGPGDVIPGEGPPIPTDRCNQAAQDNPDFFDEFCRQDLIDDGNESGLGDIVLAATFELPAEMTGAWSVAFNGRVKLPTASQEKFLGTGKTDVTTSVDVAWYGGKLVPFGRLGYRFFGDPVFSDELGEFTVDLQNGFTGSAGFIWPFEKGKSLTFAYDFFQRSLPGIDHAQEVSATFGFPIAPQWRLSAYGVAGLTEASPDFAVGFNVSWVYR